MSISIGRKEHRAKFNVATPEGEAQAPSPPALRAQLPSGLTRVSPQNKSTAVSSEADATVEIDLSAVVTDDIQVEIRDKDHEMDACARRIQVLGGVAEQAQRVVNECKEE
eukprot:SAG11_NODE_11843_length_735_cov_1.272013_1_plen_109_part_01